MIELTIEISEDLKQKMSELPEVDWSLIFKRDALKYLHRLELADFLEKKLENSEFTEKDAIKL